jgi:hypothetical protein
MERKTKMIDCTGEPNNPRNRMGFCTLIGEDDSGKESYIVNQPTRNLDVTESALDDMVGYANRNGHHDFTMVFEDGTVCEIEPNDDIACRLPDDR